MKKKVVKILSLSGIMAIVPMLYCSVAYASVNLNPKDTTGLKDKVTSIVNNFAGTLLDVIWAVSVAFLMWSGLLFIFSGGDSQKITMAKDKFKYALIGAVIAYLADKIVGVVFGFVQ